MVSIGAEGRNRTGMVSPPPNFESGASTSFATSALFLIIKNLAQERNILNNLFSQNYSANRKNHD